MGIKIKCYICGTYYQKSELLETEIKKYICAKCYVRENIKDSEKFQKIFQKAIKGK